MAPVEGFEGVEYDQADDLADFALLPPGVYPVSIEEVIDRGMSKSATPSRVYNYKCKLLNPPQGEAPPGPAGNKQKWPTHVFIRMNSSPKTISFWKKLFQACNVRWTGKNVNPNLLVGKRLMVEMVHTTYQGKVRAEPKGAGFYPMKAA